MRPTYQAWTGQRPCDEKARPALAPEAQVLAPEQWVRYFPHIASARGFCAIPYVGIPCDAAPRPTRASPAHPRKGAGSYPSQPRLTQPMPLRCPFVFRFDHFGCVSPNDATVNSKALPGHQGPRQETCPKPPSERPRTSPIRGPHDYAQRDWVAPPNRKWQI